MSPPVGAAISPFEGGGVSSLSRAGLSPSEPPWGTGARAGGLGGQGRGRQGSCVCSTQHTLSYGSLAALVTVQVYPSIESLLIIGHL